MKIKWWSMRSSHLKKLISGALFAIVVAGLCLGHMTSHAFPTKKRDFSEVVEVKYYRNSSQDVVTLKIPEGYIDRSVVGPRIDGGQDKLYFEALGPNLLSQTESNKMLFNFPANLRNVVHFNVSSLYRLLPNQIEERKKDLFESRSDSRFNPCQWSPEEDTIYGLRHQIIDPATCPKISAYMRYDRYLLRDGDNLATVIRCTPMEWKDSDPIKLDGRTPMPGTRCRHIFATKVLNGWVELRYHRNFLPHWREIEQAVEKKLTSFVVQN